MLLGLLCLMVFGAAWLVQRRGSGASGSAWGFHAPRRRLQVACGALLVLLSNAPLLRVLPWTRGSEHFFPADAASHAKVALELARGGFKYGWLESYLGGFPFGHHYPPLGWLLLALGMHTGLAPGHVVNGLGFLAILAAPLALYAAAIRASARPLHAAACGCFLALVSPYTSFVGGFEVYFTTGLVSQALALPLCITFAAAVARGARAEATLFGALTMSAHPQVCGACVSLLMLVAVLDGARGRRAALACAIAGTVVTGAALYGQGLRTLRVPFGWPPGFTWRQLGFGTARLTWWFRDGDLLDNGSSVAVLTALVAAASLCLILLSRRRVPRAFLLLGLAAVLLGSCGPALLKLGRLGSALLEFAQPLRMLALLPPIFAAQVLVALEEGSATLQAALPAGARLTRVVASAAGALVLGTLSLAVPARLRAAQQLQGLRGQAAEGSCAGVPGFDLAQLSSWISGLRGGSLWFDQGEAAPLSGCLMSRGLELQSRVALGNTSAVGSHVGVLWLAAKQLDPERAGAARRAQALGVRYVIQPASAPVPSGFARLREGRAVELFENAAAGLAHVGCVRERWSGSDHALRERLARELVKPDTADRLLDPARFIELAPGRGEVVVSPVERECDASHAQLLVSEREPGVLEAAVESPAAVDLVFSATAFPAWRVSIDGAPSVPGQIVAPGLLSVHVGRGRHQIVARGGTLPGYAAWLSLAALVVAALAWLPPPLRSGRRREAAWKRVG